jgi:hypothetical protein
MSAAATHWPVMDIKLGYALLRDRRVPTRCKVFALAIGLLVVAAIEILEIPAEGILAALVPVLGLAGDLLIDGAQTFLLPVLFASILLPYITPSSIVRQMRAERAG